MYNCVCSLNVIQELKKYEFFKQDLGLSISVPDKSGDRVLNEKDQFAFVYNSHYKRFIQKKGNIGDIVVYVDHQIQKPIIILYKDREEIVEEFNFSLVKEKGIQFYLGSLLKKLEEHCQDLIDQEEKKKVVVKQGVGEKLLKNPGNVTYEDLQAYLKQKAANRFNS